MGIGQGMFSSPFMDGMRMAIVIAAVVCVIGAVASTIRGKVRRPQEEIVDGGSDVLGLEEGLPATVNGSRWRRCPATYRFLSISSATGGPHLLRPDPALPVPAASTLRHPTMLVSPLESPEGRRQLASAISQWLAVSRGATVSLDEVQTAVE
ncbi:MAG: hypothetical protein ACXWQR_09990 [Ktedonobacterales bacterium]